MIGTAHLQHAAVAPGELEEVVGLQHHVVELEERERLLALEAQLDAVHGQHAVDREVAPDVAQERDVREAIEPFGVVGHDGVARTRAEGEKFLEHRLDARHVGGDVRGTQELARVVLARGIAHLGGASAHEHDRLVSAQLEVAQQHDADEVADMEARCRAIEADVGDPAPVGQVPVEGGGIADLVHEPALGDGAQKIGAEFLHVRYVRARWRPRTAGRGVL